MAGSSDESNPYRFINERGEVNVRRRGAPRSLMGDLHHRMLTAPWRALLLVLALFYLLVLSFFAAAFLLVADGIEGLEPGSIIGALAFSVQTLSTIGYGTIAPTSPAAHLLVAIEAFCGLVMTALFTGIVFSKFARPTARVLFAERAVVSSFNGRLALMFRMANLRGNQIVDATLSVVLARFEVTEEGERFRRFYELPMARARTSMFALSWTAIHYIDADSPLAGALSPDDKQWGAGWGEGAELIVTISGVDGTVGQLVHARHSFLESEVLVGHRYIDMLGVGANNTLEIDYGRIHKIEPIAPSDEA